MRIIRRYYNYLRYGIRNKYLRPNIKYKLHAYNKDYSDRICSFFQTCNLNIAVVFSGLKQVRYSLGAEDPYSHVDTILNNSFETVIVPTFTPAVLYTGVFDVSATESESGTFSQLFLKSAEGRTLSPFKSFALKGLMTPELLSLHTFNDYIAGGMFHFFNSNDVVSVNVGTMDIRFGTIHYLESMCNLPYIRHRDVRIRVIDSNGISRSSEYCHLDYKIRVKFSRDKIERDLHRAGIIKVLIINDMIVRIIPEIDCSDYLIKRLKADPYYLVD